MSASHSDNAIFPDKLEMPKERMYTLYSLFPYPNIHKPLTRSISAKPSTSEDFHPASSTTLAGHEQDINPTKKGSGMSSKGTAGEGSEESIGDKIKSKLGV